VQGLLQVAVALHHLADGNARGACTLFAAGREKLAPYAPEYQRVHVAALLAEIAPWERAAATDGAWPSDLAPPRLRIG
jgi:predicted metal-dependent hydrolase